MLLPIAGILGMSISPKPKAVVLGEWTFCLRGWLLVSSQLSKRPGSCGNE